MSSTLKAVENPRVQFEDLEILKSSILKNPLFKRFRVDPRRILHPYTISSEEVGIAMANNLFDLIVRTFWKTRTSRFLLGALSELPVTTPRRISEFEQPDFPNPRKRKVIRKV